MHLLGAQLVVAATALVINVLAARALEPQGRGQLALVLQLGYLLSVLVLLGADRAYPATGEGAVPPGRALTDLGRLLRVPASVVVVACVAAGLALAPRVPDAVPYALGVALLALSSSAVVAARAAVTVSRRSGPYLAAVVAGQVLLLLTCAGLLVAPVRETLWWLVAYGACTALPLVAVVAHQLRPQAQADGGARRHLADARALRWRLAPAAVSSLVMLRSDRLLIPWLASNRQLGLYVVVATLTELLYWPVQHYVDAHVPAWRSRYRTGAPGVRRLLLGAVAYLVIAGAVATVAIGLLVVPLFGSAYAESRPLVLPLVVAACCYGLSRVGIGLTLAAGRVRAPALADGAGAAVTVGLCLVLIPQQGAMGAALASLAGYLTTALVCLPAVRRLPADPARDPRPDGAR